MVGRPKRWFDWRLLWWWKNRGDVSTERMMKMLNKDLPVAKKIPGGQSAHPLVQICGTSISKTAIAIMKTLIWQLYEALCCWKGNLAHRPSLSAG